MRPSRSRSRVAPVAEHIVVSATRTEAPAGQVASAVTVFDAAQIARRQEPPLADLLRQAPGTTVVRVGAPGSVTSLFVRGGESNYTKVLLDGVPLNEPGGAFNMSNITTENLERVEFMRGANSAIYGSDAMTGVLQLFTRRGASPRPEGRVRFEGGSFSSARGSAGISAKTGRFDYSADVAGLTTDNEVPNNEFRNTTLSGSAGVALGTRRHAAVRRTGRTRQDGRARPDRIRAAGSRRLLPAARRRDGAWRSIRRRARSTSAPPMGLRRRTRRLPTCCSIPLTRRRSKDARRHSSSPISRMTATPTLRRHHASYQADGTVTTARAGTHVETALVEWDGERGHLRDALAGTDVPASRDNVGVTLQHQALVVARVRHRRRSLRAQRELRQRHCAAHRGRVVRAQG